MSDKLSSTHDFYMVIPTNILEKILSSKYFRMYYRIALQNITGRKIFNFFHPVIKYIKY